MFQNHPQLMKELIELLSDSPRLAQLMGRHPHLLDNLLSPEFMQPLPETVELVSDLQLRYQQAVDFEDALNIARRFVKDRIFQIGVQTLRRSINAKEAGLAYSHLADAVLQSLMPLILDEFCQSYGQMPGGQLVIMHLVVWGRKHDADVRFRPDPDLRNAAGCYVRWKARAYAIDLLRSDRPAFCQCPDGADRRRDFVRSGYALASQWQCGTVGCEFRSV